MGGGRGNGKRKTMECVYIILRILEFLASFLCVCCMLL